jgi:hypothetical protein
MMVFEMERLHDKLTAAPADQDATAQYRIKPRSATGCWPKSLQSADCQP